MLRFLAGLLLILSAGILVYLASPVQYYTTSKQVRLYNVWSQDLDQLLEKENFRKTFLNLSAVEIHFTDAQVAEEFKNFQSPFKIRGTEGLYILKVSITRWIEEKEYGFVIQHELFDQNNEKLHEFGRTYKVGLIF